MLALVAAAGEAPRPRIVSLAPNLTELLFAAGAGDRVVGASEFSDYPEAARGIERIGDAYRLDYERILALEPDLAVAWASGTPPDAITRLEDLGVEVYSIRTERLVDVASAIEALGALAGTPAVANEAARRFRADLAGLESRYGGLAPVRVFIEIDAELPYTVTARHLISDVVSLCGGRNIFADLPGIAPAVDLEAVIARDPQVILSTVGDADPAARWNRWPGITAVRLGHVRGLPPDEVSRATPRVLEGTRVACEAIQQSRLDPALRAR
jgi:iron complex transport system substrate-binding protein